MPTAAKPLVAKVSATARPKPKTTAIVKPAAPIRSTAKPVEKPVVVAAKKTTSAKKLTPAAPEAKKSAGAGRKRLSRVFSRPLDKKLPKIKLVRDRFAIPANEYEQLVQLKKRLSSLGYSIKKSELVRAGLLQLAAMDDANLKTATENFSVARIDD